MVEPVYDPPLEILKRLAEPFKDGLGVVVVSLGQRFGSPDQAGAYGALLLWSHERMNPAVDRLG
jgi:hypothetical protein